MTWIRRWKLGMVARGLQRVGGTTGVHPVFSDCGEVGIQARCRWSNSWQWGPNCNAWRIGGIVGMRCCGCMRAFAQDTRHMCGYRRSACLGIDAVADFRRFDLCSLLKGRVSEVEDLAAIDRSLTGDEDQ